MHKSLIERVHFYLDENEYISSESYLLRGWVFCETSKIEEIRILEEDRPIQSKLNFPLLRTDVAEVYSTFKP
jgi:hypothetical protein